METPSLVILKIPICHSISPGVRRILNTIVMSRIIKIAFSPLKMNFTGTWEIVIIPARNKVATAYPATLLKRKTEIMKTSVPNSFVRGSILWIGDFAG